MCTLFDSAMGPNICTNNLSFALYTRAYGFLATSEANVGVNGKEMGQVFFKSKTCLEKIGFLMRWHTNCSEN